MEIFGIWIGYAIAVAGTAFGMRNAGENGAIATGVVGGFGALFAMFATIATVYGN